MVASGAAAGSTADNSDAFEGTAYRAVRLIGAGGMGEVWLVEHRELGREFVAKLIHQRLMTDAQLVDRVRIEAQSLGRLSHPNIVSISGIGQTVDGRPFIVMEQLRGANLAQELRARRIPVQEAVDLTRQLLRALSATHALGIVHRDIKPENLFLHTGSDGLRVLKVLDFGVARILPGVSAQAPMPLFVPTGDGVVVGTPRFVSPEVASGQVIDARADVYSVGLILYILLAGRGPFDHVSGQDRVLTAHAVEEPMAPSAFATSPVPAELDALVLHALRKDPNHRFQTAEQFESALAQVAERLDGTQGWPPTTTFDASQVEAGVVPEGLALPDALAFSAPLANQTHGAAAFRGIIRAALLVAITFVAALAGMALVRGIRLLWG